MDFILAILIQGLIFGILGLGAYITYKILDFPDLTCDGSFPLGASVTAILISKGISPLLAIIVSILAGGFAGFLTGVIHVKGKIRDLLSGIIMMTALWTINLRIAGTSNVPIFNNETIFKNKIVEKYFASLNKLGSQYYTTLAIVLIIVIITKILLDLYLSSKSGFLLRAVGDNHQIVTSLAKNQGNVKILGLSISNALIAMAGSIFCQEERVFDIGMGTGAIVIGLASVIIGTSLFKNLTFMKTTTAVILGSIIYKACTGIAMRNFLPQDMKLVTAVLFLVILLVVKDRKKKVIKNA